MLLDHRKLTDRAVAHLLPERFVDLVGDDGTGSVVFLYELLDGGWQVGHIGCTPGTTTPSRARLMLFATLPKSKPRDTAHLCFEEYLRLRIGQCRGTLRPLARLHLASELELELAHALGLCRTGLGAWSSDAPSVQRDTESMTPATRIALFRALADHSPRPAGAVPGLWTPHMQAIKQWLDSLAAPDRGAPPWMQAILLPTESRCWAYLLHEAAASQQDGVSDVLQVLARTGAEGFCSLLPDGALSYLVARVDEARKGQKFARGPRYTVADFVGATIGLFADVLLEQWNFAPMEVRAPSVSRAL